MGHIKQHSIGPLDMATGCAQASKLSQNFLADPPVGPITLEKLHPDLRDKLQIDATPNQTFIKTGENLIANGDFTLDGQGVGLRNWHLTRAQIVQVVAAPTGGLMARVTPVFGQAETSSFKYGVRTSSGKAEDIDQFNVNIPTFPQTNLFNDNITRPFGDACGFGFLLDFNIPEMTPPAGETLAGHGVTVIVGALFSGDIQFSGISRIFGGVGKGRDLMVMGYPQRFPGDPSLVNQYYVDFIGTPGLTYAIGSVGLYYVGTAR